MIMIAHTQPGKSEDAFQCVGAYGNSCWEMMTTYICSKIAVLSLGKRLSGLINSFIHSFLHGSLSRLPPMAQIPGCPSGDMEMNNRSFLQTRWGSCSQNRGCLSLFPKGIPQPKSHNMTLQDLTRGMSDPSGIAWGVLTHEPNLPKHLRGENLRKHQR